MDAWMESLALTIVVVTAGFTALGTRVDAWQPRAVAAPVSAAVADTRCVALHAGPLAHRPKCATAVPSASAASDVRVALRSGD